MRHVTWMFTWDYWPCLAVYDRIMTIELCTHHSWRDKRILPLTHDVEAAVEFADAVPCPPLPHLPDLHPLVQMGVKALNTGQRRHAVVASHGIHKVLAERVQWGVSTWVAAWLFALQSYPECHGSHSTSGGVHWSDGAPGVTFNVVTLHVVKAGVVIQAPDSVDRTTQSSQSYSPPEKTQFSFKSDLTSILIWSEFSKRFRYLFVFMEAFIIHLLVRGSNISMLPKCSFPSWPPTA